MDADTFLKLLNPSIPSTSSAKTTDPEPIGASIRWAVGFDEQSDPHLEIQSVPTGAKNLNKKFFNSDNSVSVLLGSYPLQADIFTSSFAKGLIPIFFAPNRLVAAQYLATNPDKTKEIVNSVNSRFLRMEHLSPDACTSYLKAKKLRAPKGVSAFPIQQIGRKRGRPAAQDIAESGT